MADNASQMWRTQFADRTMAIYQQRGGRLRGMVQSTDKFNGTATARFYLAGKSTATETTAAGQQNVPSGMGITPFDVSLRTFTVYEHIYEFDEDRMSIDEKEVVYDAAANAMGRKSDTVIFAAAYAAVTTFTTNCDFSAGAFSAPAAMTMCMALQGQKVPWDGNVFCLLPQQAWNEFLLNKVVNSADHVNRDDLPFTKATDSRFWNGVNWLLYVEETAEDMYLSTGFGGAGKQDTLMWHQSALGWAPHTDMQVKTQWHNEIDALSINMKMKGAPTTLQQGNGIIRARLRSTGTLALV
jgi:hypothetical protein